MGSLILTLSFLAIAITPALAGDSEVVAALRGEGLLTELAADLLCTPLATVHNNAAIDQIGTGNRSVSLQHGTGNAVSLIQQGQANQAYAIQYGTGNSTSVNQQGNSNITIVTQVGSGNHTSVYQPTAGQYLAITQVGTGLDASIGPRR